MRAQRPWAGRESRQLPVTGYRSLLGQWGLTCLPDLPAWKSTLSGWNSANSSNPSPSHSFQSQWLPAKRQEMTRRHKKVPRIPKFTEITHNSLFVFLRSPLLTHCEKTGFHHSLWLGVKANTASQEGHLAVSLKIQNTHDPARPHPRNEHVTCTRSTTAMLSATLNDKRQPIGGQAK